MEPFFKTEYALYATDGNGDTSCFGHITRGATEWLWRQQNNSSIGAQEIAMIVEKLKALNNVNS